MSNLAKRTSDDERSEWRVIASISETALLRRFGIHEFEPKLDFSFDVGHLRIKTAESPEEVENLLRLRFEIFKSHSSDHLRIDVDEFDVLADHLMVIDKRDEKVVGTYRIIFSEFTSGFYTNTEFDLAEFFRLPGTKLELGRACVRPDSRDGRVIQSLWLGLAHYIKLVEPRYVFGCSSVMSTKAQHVAEVHRFLSSHTHKTLQTPVRNPYRWKGELKSSSDKPENAVQLLDPLLRVYLKAGAKIAGGPALDKDFGCVDYFTVLETEHLTSAFQRKFMGK